MIASIWVWLRTSKLGIWLASLGTVLVAIGIWVWSIKRKAYKEVLHELKEKQYKNEDRLRKKARTFNRKTKKFIEDTDIPDDFDVIELHRARGKKYKIPTD